MTDGSIAFVLNAHLPFVRHPAHEDFLEERWLFEAITETYIPLLETLGSLDRDAVPTRLTLSLSPTLLGQLADPLLHARYLRHLARPGAPGRPRPARRCAPGGPPRCSRRATSAISTARWSWPRKRCGARGPTRP